MASKNRKLLDEALQNNGTVPKKVETITPVPTVEPKPVGEAPAMPSEVKVAPVAAQGNGNETATNGGATKGGGSATAATTAQSSNTPTVTVPTQPEETHVSKVGAAPSWDDLVAELNKLDEQSQEEQEKHKKKVRRAKAIAALGDFATHAMNVWGSTYGYNMPIKGAPLTEAVQTKAKEEQSKQDAKYKEMKERRTDAYKSAYESWKKRMDIAIKQDEGERKERAAENREKYMEARLEYLWAENERKEKKSQLELQKKEIEAEIKSLELEYKKETQPLKKAELQARIDASRARITKMEDDARRADERLAIAERQLRELERKNKARESYLNKRKAVVFSTDDGELAIDGAIWDSAWPEMYRRIAKAEGVKGNKHKTNADKIAFVKANWKKYPAIRDEVKRLAEASTRWLESEWPDDPEEVGDSEEQAMMPSENPYQQYLIS